MLRIKVSAGFKARILRILALHEMLKNILTATLNNQSEITAAAEDENLFKTSLQTT